MQNISSATLDSLYPTPVIRGVRVARLGEKYLGPVATDAETCGNLGKDQVGWFVGGVQTYERMIDNARGINDSKLGGHWIVVPATKFLAEVAYEQWFDKDLIGVDGTHITMWHDDSVTFCVPERLKELSDAIMEREVPVAGIVLLDPNCIVHRGRGFGRGKARVVHDRPQLIVNFRSKLAIGTWCPPLIVMSLRKPAAVSAIDVTRIYGLEAMHFIEGWSLRCGINNKPPKESATNYGRNSATLVSQ